MIAERLRKAVLQAAFEGRLTGQFSDENSIDKNVIKFENNNHLLFIPGTWKWMKMKEVIDVRDGTHDTPKYYKTGIPLVTSKNLNNGTIDFSTCKFISYEDYLNINRRSNVDDDDILFAMIGSIGNPVIVKKDREFSIKNMALFKKSDFVISKYLYYYLIYSDDTFKRNASGAVQSFVSLKYLRNFFIPVPSKEEQKRIVEKLEILLAEIDKLEQDEKALKELEDKFPERLKSAIIESAMKGKITNQDLNDNSVVEILTKIEINKGIKFRVINEDEKPYSIPMNWVWISHNDILEISGGSQPPKSTFSELPKENYIRLYQIRDYGLNPQPVYIPIETATKQTKKGDILLARYGASLGKVFYAEEGAYNVAMAKVIPLFKEDILYNDFLYYYYKSSQYQSLVLKNTRSAQAGFNKNDLNKLLIALPPIEEQKRIVDKLDKLFQLNFMIK